MPKNILYIKASINFIKEDKNSIQKEAHDEVKVEEDTSLVVAENIHLMKINLCLIY